ncbi:MAG: hypothetical protein ACRBFS_07115 [Aureispira sp.]
MDRIVLLIDNENIDATREAIEEYAEVDTDIKNPVKCLKWFNPVDRKFYEGEEYNFELARQFLVEEILGQKIDVVGCDFNLHSTNKTLTYDIIETIRKFNRSASVFIYSGGMNRTTLQMFGDEGKKPAERYLQIAISSNICDYINNRGALVEKVIAMLKSPSLGLQIENYLMENESLKLQHFTKEFKGKQLFEIAKEVRSQSELGVLFCNELIERSVSHLIDLNNY